jgi:nucleotide-binding universal stress UspA family protein/CBS domain-containing protein
MLEELSLPPPVRVPATATLREVAAVMEDRHVSSVLVGTAPARLVTEYDLAGALAAGLDAGTPVTEVATQDPLWTSTASTLVDAVGMMTTTGVRHLLVLSPEGTERGVLSLAEATRALLGSEVGGSVSLGSAALSERGAGPPPVVRTIAVGIDGSAHAETALRWAVSLGQQAGATVVAVHALGLLEHGAGPTADLGASVRKAAAIDHLPPERVRYVTEHGDPCSVLCRAAGPPTEADLLVVGSRGRGAHAGLLLGSTSHALAERSPVPLVIVPVTGARSRGSSIA